MIISLDELMKANQFLAECREELNKTGTPYNPNMKVGIMIETPAAVICADIFAKHVDFFSIGTNDLTQYILAIDRGNNRIAPMFDSFHPAVIQCIKRVIDTAHENGIEVSLCGELAGDAQAAMLLLGLGLDEFSMPAGEIYNIKRIIRKISYEKAKACAERVGFASTAQEVKNSLSEFLPILSS
jgi:phosphotransferase system enzyme I (PtsI)